MNTTPGYAAPLHTSRQHINQSAQVAHTPGGTITLALTEAAADVLAKLLFAYDAETVTSPVEERRSVDRYDSDFWTQVATTLATQRVIALHVPTPAEIHAHTVLVPKVTLVGPIRGHGVKAVVVDEAARLGDDTLAMVAEQDAVVRSL